MYEANPTLNGRYRKTFDTKEEAIKYLQKVTGYEMKTDKKTGINDWELVGKLYAMYEVELEV